jgi:hypothetical protein
MTFVYQKSWLTLAAAISLLFSACSSDQAPPDCAKFGEAVELINPNLLSRITVEDFQANNQVFKLGMIRSEDYPAQGKCDLYGITTVGAEYTHHQIAGDMTFSFFNNQLKQVLFYPKNLSDSTALLAALCEKDKICLQTDSEFMRKGTQIRKGMTTDNRFYIVWEDFCLMEQMNAWLAKCN